MQHPQCELPQTCMHIYTHAHMHTCIHVKVSFALLWNWRRKGWKGKTRKRYLYHSLLSTRAFTMLTVTEISSKERYRSSFTQQAFCHLITVETTSKGFSRSLETSEVKADCLPWTIHMTKVNIIHDGAEPRKGIHAGELSLRGRLSTT